MRSILLFCLLLLSWTAATKHAQGNHVSVDTYSHSGACCHPSGCTMKNESTCEFLYRGNDTSCASDCDGACCTDSMCTEVQEVNCVDGTFHAIGTVCELDGSCPSNDVIFILPFIFGTLIILLLIFFMILACTMRIWAFQPIEAGSFVGNSKSTATRSTWDIGYTICGVIMIILVLVGIGFVIWWAT